MTTERTHEIIPEGEIPCIWMEAGTVGFKLCDRQYDCEHCPFDTVIRQQLRQAERKSSCAPVARRPAVERSGDLSQLEKYLDRQLALLLRPFLEPSLPTDRLYAANHLWVQGNDTQSFTVGVDHLLLHLLGSVSTIAFLSTPAHAHVASPCSWIIQRHGTVALKTPLAGVITQTNERLTQNPSLLNGEPYGEGWIFRLTAEKSDLNQSRLLSAEKAAAAFLRQAETLRLELHTTLTDKSPAVGTTLYDGGQQVENVEEIVGPATYF